MGGVQRPRQEGGVTVGPVGTLIWARGPRHPPFPKFASSPRLFLTAGPTPAGSADACLSGAATALWDLVPGSE